MKKTPLVDLGPAAEPLERRTVVEQISPLGQTIPSK